MISSEEPILVYTIVVTALQLIQAIIVVSSVLVDDLVGVFLVRVWRADSFSQITGIIVAKFKLIDDVTIIDDGKPAFLNCSPKLIQAVVVTRKAVFAEIKRAIFPMGDPSTYSRIGGYLYKPATTGVGVPDLMLPLGVLQFTIV